MVAADCIQLQHDNALERLRDAILRGDIKPGAKLVQEELAQRYNMSRIPLREALRTLEGEGLVTSTPRRGARCRPLDAKDIDDLYTVRLALERLAVRSAAARYVDLRASTAARGQRAERVSGNEDRSELFYLDREFHDEIAAASDNAHLTRTLGQSWSQIMRAMYYYFKMESYPHKVWDEHRMIAHAIVVGDPDRAEHLLEKHITNSRDMILRGLREHVL
jgi:DNA-binding GntR family transcriptional regulator